MHILQIRDKDGNFVPIPAIKGNDGKSAYEQAREGGYTGTEEEFITLLNGLTNSEDTEHRADLNNPHRVTKEHIGLGNADNTPDADKPVSTAQAAAIADAKKSGTDAQTNLGTHIADAGKHVNINELGGIGIGSINIVEDDGVAVGKEAWGGPSGVAIGLRAEADSYGTAVGSDAYTINSGGVAIGHGARAMDDGAIQIGSGTNNEAGTLQVGYYQLMDIDGNIPSERLPIATGSYVGAGTVGTGTNCNTLTFPFKPKLVVVQCAGSTAGGFCWTYGSKMGYTFIDTPGYVILSWNDTELSWYYPYAVDSDAAGRQLNAQETTYNYIAIG